MVAWGAFSAEARRGSGRRQQPSASSVLGFGPGLGLRALGSPSDLTPQIIPSCTCFGGVREDSRVLEFLRQGLEGILELVAREPVALGSHHQKWPVRGDQEFQQLAITL